MEKNIVKSCSFEDKNTEKYGPRLSLLPICSNPEENALADVVHKNFRVQIYHSASNISNLNL